MNFFTGNKDKFHQLSTQTPEQQKLLSNLLNQIGQMNQPGGSYQGAQSYLSQLLQGDQGAFDRFAEPHRQRFNEYTLPGIAERFAGMGGGLGGGAGSSSGFAQALGGAGAQFEGGLSGLYAQLQQQAANQALGQYNTMTNQGLGTQAFQNMYQPGTTGALGGILSGLGQGLGMGFGGSYGNGLSSAFSNWFNRGPSQAQPQYQDSSQDFLYGKPMNNPSRF